MEILKRETISLVSQVVICFSQGGAVIDVRYISEKFPSVSQGRRGPYPCPWLMALGHVMENTYGLL